MDVATYLKDSKFQFVEINTIAQLLEQKKNFGYYYIFDSSGLFNPLEIESIKLIKFFKQIDLDSLKGEMEKNLGPIFFKRIQSAEARKFLPIPGSKKSYAVELDTVVSFKEKENTWITHVFANRRDRDKWLEGAVKQGKEAKAINANDRKKYAKKRCIRNYFAAINPKGGYCSPDDTLWSVYCFNDRCYRNNWVREKNAHQRLAIALSESDVYRYARIKHNMPIKKTADGLVISDSTNRRVHENKKYYFGVNKVNLDLPPSDPNWVIYAAESIMECNSLIESMNSKQSGCAKKVDRVFAYKALGLKFADIAYLDSDNKVSIYPPIRDIKRIA